MRQKSININLLLRKYQLGKQIYLPLSPMCKDKC